MSIQIRTTLDEELGALVLPIAARNPEWRLAALVLLVDVCAIVKKLLQLRGGAKAAL